MSEGCFSPFLLSRFSFRLFLFRFRFLCVHVLRRSEEEEVAEEEESISFQNCKFSRLHHGALCKST